MNFMMKSIIPSFIFFLLLNITSFAQKSNYAEEWAKADSIENLGLPKTALEIVEKIFASAIAEKNSSQLLKATIFKLKYISMFEENAFIKIESEYFESNVNLIYR